MSHDGADRTAADRAGQERAPESRQNAQAVLAEIQSALQGLRYGQVVIVVQDGVVVQIDRIERRRLARRANGGNESD